MVNKNLGNNWITVSKKIGKFLAATLIAGLAVKYGQSNWYIMVAPFLLSAENVLTHSKWWNS